MFKPIVAKSVGVVLAAAVAAGMAGLITSAAPEARAEPMVASTQLGKGDRLPVPAIAADCSAQSWPNFDQSCIRRPGDKARTVRVIAIR